LKTNEALKIHNMKTILAKMNELKREIRLTDDDIAIIIYTSMDQDYFTNMLIQQGEFLKWFNLNFAGESQEEQDFLENKQDQWLSACTLAQEVISAYGDL
jgi:hypothetical protein